ncbi:uncharacterized protein MONBRDRAFT_37942 [Monosiga brevicollis MX1]|uniref:Uncharacterized protein n=1 Tax=Monosiga brevicollis TaxID=81824 RepID=A9V4Q0_MONBE|nr:uncharacterized protein MONBRDRAFT_37942 [Monosiga brevicollis MX1]EDQ87408.1 predicted protein [Monosiga brevicollis MX1]|eukprot:XP_001747668.1 hypothetical protein [Monosiga brevicollis MX1]
MDQRRGGGGGGGGAAAVGETEEGLKGLGVELEVDLEELEGMVSPRRSPLPPGGHLHTLAPAFQVDGDERDLLSRYSEDNDANSGHNVAELWSPQLAAQLAQDADTVSDQGDGGGHVCPEPKCGKGLRGEDSHSGTLLERAGLRRRRDLFLSEFVPCTHRANPYPSLSTALPAASRAVDSGLRLQVPYTAIWRGTITADFARRVVSAFPINTPIPNIVATSMFLVLVTSAAGYVVRHSCVAPPVPSQAQGGELTLIAALAPASFRRTLLWRTCVSTMPTIMLPLA